MRTIISAAVTRDGYMDDCSAERLVISDDEDWRQVYALRARCDAIMVGAETLRKDNPALVIRDPQLRAARVAAGKPADITKISLSRHGSLNPQLRFFTEGSEAHKIVFVGREAPVENIAALSSVAEVVVLPEITATAIADVLDAKGIGKLMIEGGEVLIKTFVDQKAVDEVRLAKAPFTLADVGENDAIQEQVECIAPRFPYYGELPFAQEAVDTRTEIVGRMTVEHYTINAEPQAGDRELLERAIEVSRNCKPSTTAYSVGCVIKTASGEIFEGYTHETSPLNHAEEEAFAKALAAGVALRGAMLFSSMEPCSTRASKPVSCSELIIRHGIGRVVYAFAEPDRFVRCEGRLMLRRAGIEVLHLWQMGDAVRQINAHLLVK